MTAVEQRKYERPKVELRDSKFLPSDQVLMNHLINKFVKNEAELIVPKVPGGVYYRDLMREKARMRNNQEAYQNEETAALRRMRCVKRVKRARRPPSVKPRTVNALKKALEKLREEQQLQEKKDYIADVRKREEEEIRAARERFNKFKRYSMAIVTKNNSKFEPGKLTSTMLKQHNKAMAAKFDRSRKDSESTQQETFISKLRGNVRAGDAISQPEAKHPQQPESAKAAHKRPSSAPKTHHTGSGGDPSATPKAADTPSRTSSRGMSGRGKLSRELSELDLDVETGVRPLLSENPAYRDWETCETSISYLEEKVKAFNMKQDPSHYRSSVDHLPPLARFEAKDETVQQPKAGGRVLVNTKPCTNINKNRYYMKDHQHTHVRIVEEVDGYDDMRKARMIRHMMMDEERRDWLQEEAQKYKKSQRASITF